MSAKVDKKYPFINTRLRERLFCCRT